MTRSHIEQAIVIYPRFSKNLILRVKAVSLNLQSSNKDLLGIASCVTVDNASGLILEISAGVGGFLNTPPPLPGSLSNNVCRDLPDGVIKL
jgi:hypothetical protein